jgi:hypothetical protein
MRFIVLIKGKQRKLINVVAMYILSEIRESQVEIKKL